MLMRQKNLISVPSYLANVLIVMSTQLCEDSMNICFVLNASALLPQSVLFIGMKNAELSTGILALDA